MHAAAFVEEALGNDGGLRGNRSQHGSATDDVLHGLLRAGIIQAAFKFEPVHCRAEVRRRFRVRIRRATRDEGTDFIAQVGNMG